MLQPGWRSEWARRRATLKPLPKSAITDFTDNLEKIDVPVLLMHGDDDQILPIADSALLSSRLLKRGNLKVYPGLPHGMCTTHPEIINPDLLAFIRD